MTSVPVPPRACAKFSVVAGTSRPATLLVIAKLNCALLTIQLELCRVWLTGSPACGAIRTPCLPTCL